MIEGVDVHACRTPTLLFPHQQHALFQRRCTMPIRVRGVSTSAGLAKCGGPVRARVGLARDDVRSRALRSRVGPIGACAWTRRYGDRSSWPICTLKNPTGIHAVQGEPMKVRPRDLGAREGDGRTWLERSSITGEAWGHPAACPTTFDRRPMWTHGVQRTAPACEGAYGGACAEGAHLL